jgi:hypothetical protein
LVHRHGRFIPHIDVQHSRADVACREVIEAGDDESPPQALPVVIRVNADDKDLAHRWTGVGVHFRPTKSNDLFCFFMNEEVSCGEPRLGYPFGKHRRAPVPLLRVSGERGIVDGKP